MKGSAPAVSGRALNRLSPLCLPISSPRQGRSAFYHRSGPPMRFRPRRRHAEFARRTLGGVRGAPSEPMPDGDRRRDLRMHRRCARHVGRREAERPARRCRSGRTPCATAGRGLAATCACPTRACPIDYSCTRCSRRAARGARRCFARAPPRLRLRRARRRMPRR